MLTLKNITKTYEVAGNTFQVLKWVDVEIQKWDFVSIMWPSWSGKSTLMNIIGMLDTPSSGEYLFSETQVHSLSEDQMSKIRGKNIGFIFQSYNLIPRMTVLKQVMLPLAYVWVSYKEREKQALIALDKVGLLEKKNNKPNELSGWQQQRVSIARALAMNPAFILADEPTGALDTQTWIEIMKLLVELNNEGKTIILITHEKEIDEYAKKHILIKDGVIVSYK